jgi:hypothetical protein
MRPRIIEALEALPQARTRRDEPAAPTPRCPSAAYGAAVSSRRTGTASGRGG